MKKSIFITIGLFISFLFACNSNKTKIVQKVEPNFFYNHLYEMEFVSINKDTINDALENWYKRVLSPYELMTTYKNESFTDYGTYKEIDSLKCIRYNEMKKRINYIDSVSIIKEKEQQILMDKQDKELRQLNKKCE